MNESNNIKKIENKEISEIYKIFEEIYLRAPPLLKDLSNNTVDIDYTESIHEQIDLKKIDKKFRNGEYCSITDAIKDIRKVFLNCYSFYGARSDHTKKSLELEELLEEKISHLDNNYKVKADVNLTFNLLNMEGKPSSKLRYPKDCYDSVLLRSVAHCRPKRLKKYHKILSTTFSTDEDNAHILEKILSWENEVYFNDVFHRYISSMWELPEIGNFVAILFKKLSFDIINQGEIERMFLMPKESTTMGKIMTTLLMPVKKTKFIGQVMPYKVWSDKLSKKVSGWCKVYHAKKQNKVIVMNSLGIHPDFWAVVNQKNPLIEKDYSELSYFKKVWLVKALCDYVTIKFKTINDIVTNCNERQCTIWKNDLETEEYFFFDSMPDLRIYYYNIPYDEPSLEFLESVKTDIEEIKVEDNLPMNGVSGGFRSLQKDKHFKLIADSVEGLQTFLYELDMEGTSVPENLISALKNFIEKIEPEEYNFIVLNNASKIKLFKDWESYPNRIQKDEDNMSLWEEKDSKSIAQAQNELEKRLSEEGKMLKYDTNNLLDTNQNGEYNGHSETLVCSKNKDDILLLEMKDSMPIAQAQNTEIISQKRTRKLIVRHDFEIDKFYESEEYLSKNYVKSVSDFTDSEDEWGAMNQPKNKVRQPLRTPSKLVELEKQLSEKDKISEHNTNKVFSTNNKDKSIKSVELLKTRNEVIFNNTDTLVNGHNKRLVDTNNIDNVPSCEEVVLIDSDKEENEKLPNGLKQIEIINLDEDIQNDIEIVNDNFETSISTQVQTENNIRKTNEQDNYKQIESAVTSIEDDDQIIISDDEDDIQFISMTVKPKSTPPKINIPRSLKTNLNKSYNSVSTNRQITPTNHIKHQATSSIIHKLSQNVTIMPANVHVPKGIEVTMVKTPQRRIDSHFNSIKRRSTMENGHVPNNPYTIMPANVHVPKGIEVTMVKTPQRRIDSHFNSIKRRSTMANGHVPNNPSTIMPANVHVPKGIEVTMVKTPQRRIDSHFNSIKRRSTMANGHVPNNPSTIDVKCEVISKPNLNGEVKFYIRLPNGKEHPGPDELINQYLKQHNNQLPHYWLVPLPVEVAKHYGIY